MLWTLWLAAEVLLLQAALASWKEFEPRATAIFTGLFLILLIARMAGYVRRRRKHQQVEASSDKETKSSDETILPEST